MQLGTVSEWVTGISSLLAVCVALFLPYYNERREQRRKQRNIRYGISYLTGKAMCGSAAALHELNLFLIVNFLGNTNQQTEHLVLIGRQIEDILNKQTPLSAEQQAAIADLLKQLQK